MLYLYNRYEACSLAERLEKGREQFRMTRAYEGVREGASYAGATRYVRGPGRMKKRMLSFSVINPKVVVLFVQRQRW